MTPRTIFLWTTALAACLLTGFALGRRAPTPAPPLGPGRALDALHAAEPSWLYYPVSETGLDAGFYATTRPRRQSELCLLVRGPERRAEWEGVLLVSRAPPGATFAAEEGAVRVGPFLLVGDAGMVRRAADALAGAP